MTDDKKPASEERCVKMLSGQEKAGDLAPCNAPRDHKIHTNPERYWYHTFTPPAPEKAGEERCDKCGTVHGEYFNRYCTVPTGRSETDEFGPVNLNDEKLDILPRTDAGRRWVWWCCSNCTAIWPQRTTHWHDLGASIERWSGEGSGWSECPVVPLTDLLAAQKRAEARVAAYTNNVDTLAEKINRAEDEIDALTAERDAALATVERVRALVSDENRDGRWPAVAGSLIDAILAALDAGKGEKP